MRPFRVSLKCLQCQHPAYVFLQHYSESCHVVHQIKENEEKKTCPNPPPPPHLHQKRPYTYIARHQENQRYPKPIKVNLKNRLPTCEHKLSHFDSTIYLKSKLQIQNTITKLPMSTTTATVHTFCRALFTAWGSALRCSPGTHSLLWQRWLISWPVMSIFWLKTIKLSRCAVVHRHRPDIGHLYFTAP